ncbi:Zeatin O-xylosyltransferase [Morus notabilis]|uniref:Zeatin O-xylosyltransferase n=1 Tax=Morus notabilis TaxID=981085 RepID=W9QK57_9ROSA|nr:zeatin O-xylosyltransferase [Morus notabilis]EXB39082.1 Zeatin O-xylosyltransferase [Morus notabilis]
MANQSQENLEKKSSSSSAVVVVVVPFPSQSHLNQLFNLSHIISSHDIPVHYVGSTLHNAQVKSRANQALNDTKKMIQFHDFPIPHFQSPLPNDIKFPSHLMPSFEATIKHLQQPFYDILTMLSKTATRVVVIHDPLMNSVVQDSSTFPNTESYQFHCVSPLYHFTYVRDILGVQIGHDADNKYANIPSLEKSITSEFEAFVAYQDQFVNQHIIKTSGHLYNTCRLLESTFLDFMLEMNRESDENVKMWAIGPLKTVTSFKNRSPNRVNGEHKCLEWLDKQESNSVLYISFGTTTFMKDEQIRELAVGLEKSGVKFLWVLRDADKGNVFDEGEVRRPQLPQGFEDRVKEKGIVVRDWAPQLEILGHSSTGGFMSHCGWNSCLESISLGVPIAAWSMHSDQPINAVLMTDLLKIGVVIREWAKKDELVSSSVVEEFVKRLMKSEEGNEVRKRAEELGYELRKATAQGGVSRLELDSFIAHITRS